MRKRERIKVLINDLPRPRAATSVANNMGVLPALNSANEEIKEKRNDKTENEKHYHTLHA